MKFYFVIFLSLFASFFLMAQEKTLTAEADPWPPYVDKANPTDGLALEIIRAAYKTEGYTVKMTYVPWSRASNEVASGTVDILPDTWMTEDQKKVLAYSEPYAQNEIKFIKLKGDPFEYTGLDSLKGKTIGIIRDYGYNDAFLKSDLFKKEEVTDLMTNINKLTAKRIDLTLEDPIVATYVMNATDPTALSKIQFSKVSLSRVGLYVCVGLKNPRHQELIDAFNRGLTKIKADGTYKKLFDKYGVSE
jgi:ABC-type amino acid transport/signal transduction systems, periplasmic component/domain